MADWGGEREGAGRCTLFKGKRAINLKLTEEAIQILTAKAKEEGVSRSDFLNRLIINIQ